MAMTCTATCQKNVEFGGSLDFQFFPSFQAMAGWRTALAGTLPV
jgi:hypothetical protein